MSDSTTTKTPPSPCCGPAIDDATRVAVAKAHCAIYRSRCDDLESQLDSACDEINAHREFHENDLTREHRDLIRSQSLAMLSADTRIAASTAALGVFCAVGAPYISQGVDNATDYIVKALRGAGKSIGRSMEDPDFRAGFISSLVSSFVASSGISLDDMIGSAPTPAPQGAPPAPKSDAPTATPSPKAAPAAKKRAPKRKA